MKRLTLALAVSAPLLLSGCDFIKKIFGGAEDAVNTAAGRQSAWPRDPAADIRNQGDIYSGGQLVRAADRAGQAVGAADGRDPGRVTFDGGVDRPGDAGFPGAPLLGRDSGGTYVGDIAVGPRPPLAMTPGQDRRSDLQTAPPPALTLPPGTAVGSAVGGGPTLAQYDAFQRMPQLFHRVYDVVSRSGWGAQAPRTDSGRQNPNKVTVHHTDGTRPTELAQSIAVVRAIQHDHRNISDARKGGRWADIGYHFLIDGAGRVFEGRHAETIGAHAGAGNNRNNVGIALMGNFDRMQLLDPQRESLVRLVTFLSIRYRRDPSARGFIESHEHYTGTDCPGRNVLDFLNSGELMRQASVEYARVASDSRLQPLAIIPPSA
ncbi:MAG: peptidoglycan recognition family protein [Elusimicrobiota bacterium]|nr:peptidoglycan recognition family protein [Elusimicrobiota bacterium]